MTKESKWVLQELDEIKELTITLDTIKHNRKVGESTETLRNIEERLENLLLSVYLVIQGETLPRGYYYCSDHCALYSHIDPRVDHKDYYIQEEI